MTINKTHNGTKDLSQQQQQQQQQQGDLKIAIVPHDDLVDINKKESPNWFLYNYHKSHKVEMIIDYAKNIFTLDPSAEYSLVMKPDDKSPSFRFVTDENRPTIVQGAVFYIYHSVSVVVSRILTELKSGSIQEGTLKQLLDHAGDAVFVAEFERQQGFPLLITGFRDKKFNPHETVYLLDVFLKIMEHDIIRWPTVDRTFIELIVQTIINSRVENDSEDRRVVSLALLVLESSILNCSRNFLSVVTENLPMAKLCRLLEHEAWPELQQNCLALINAIMQHSDLARRRELFKLFQDSLLRYIVNRSTESESSRYGSEIAHQLYCLQTWLLRVYEEDLYSGTSRDVAEASVREIARNYESAFDRDEFAATRLGVSSTMLFRSQTSLASSATSGSSLDPLSQHHQYEEFERFGFPSATNPCEVFAEPPGTLVLNLLLHYSRKHNDSFVRFVSENSSPGERHHDCPLVVASFRVISLICDLLGLGKPPRDQGKEFYPMLLKTDNPLEEFFAVGLSLFNRTWHEIHATSNDLDVVCDFVGEKFTKALAQSNATATFECFRKELNRITYAEISKRWNEERDRRDKQIGEMAPVKRLKELLRPAVVQLIKDNRLAYLVKGTRFDKYTAKGQRVKDKFWYCRLSSNHKTLLYGDCDEECHALDEVLINRLPVADIARLVLGKECPHMRDTKGKKSTSQMAFALIAREDSSAMHPSLCFVAPKPDVYDLWVDALNALLDQPMTSNEATRDQEMLLEMDLKLRLLDIEGLPIPEKAPELPPSPTDFNFQFQPTSGVTTSILS